MHSVATPIEPVDEVVNSPELDALRAELGTLHDIFASLNGGSIRASEWPRAKRALEYIDEKIKPLEAKVQELSKAPKPESA